MAAVYVEALYIMLIALALYITGIRCRCSAFLSVRIKVATLLMLCDCPRMSSLQCHKWQYRASLYSTSTCTCWARSNLKWSQTVRVTLQHTTRYCRKYGRIRYQNVDKLLASVFVVFRRGYQLVYNDGKAVFPTRPVRPYRHQEPLPSIQDSKGNHRRELEEKTRRLNPLFLLFSFPLMPIAVQKVGAQA